MGVQDMMTTLNLSVGVLHAIDCSTCFWGEIWPLEMENIYSVTQMFSFGDNLF